MADRVIEHLNRFSESGQPFFLRFDPEEPHLPCRPPRDYGNLYPPGAIEPWTSFPDSLEEKPLIQSRQHRIWGTEDWKLVWNPAGERNELYDLKADPGELRNVIADPACERPLREMTRRLISWMESIEDPLYSSFTRMLLEPAGVGPPPVGNKFNRGFYK